jgi:hypothetical protein
MKSIDPLLDRERTDTYNCRHFVREAWQHLTDEDLLVRVPRLFDLQAAPVNIEEGRTFENLATPVTPCIVLMQANNHEPHVGVFINDSILHLTDSYGVELQPASLVTRLYTKVRYYR